MTWFPPEIIFKDEGAACRPAITTRIRQLRQLARAAAHASTHETQRLMLYSDFAVNWAQL
ncbi:MAG: hypothetical protein ACR2G4_15210 [Pyrinomonadaceae bacterium]